jgi:hypothetical protein
MDSVEANTVIDQNPNPVATVSTDDEMGAVWDRIERDNNAARDASGKFTTTIEHDPAEEPAGQAPLEGGEEGAADRVAESSTPAAVEVPLPSNWRGLEEAWEKIPVDIRPAVREHAEKLHQQAAKLGQEVSAYKPIGEVIQKHKDYFDGTKYSYKPHEGIDYLFNLQRKMDDSPFDTLMEIADTYGLRQELATRFGAGGEAVNPDTQSLLTEIGQLKSMLRENSDPNKISSLIDQRLNADRVTTQVNDVISRTATKEAMPFYADVEAELPFFISKAWAKLGETASQDAVLKLGYDMAVNADPDLRAKVAAPKVAATNTDPARLAAAKNANQSNLRSTSPGKPRELTNDEALAEAWDKAQRA